MSTRVIVIGGGLAGVSAANQVVQNGGNVLVLDKNAICGGNSTKATSGINGTYTTTQQEQHITDSVKQFQDDIYLSSTSGKERKEYELGRVLALESGDAIEWLKNSFKIDLSLVAQLGGHSSERTHRGKEFFPGMSITMGLLKALEAIQKVDKKKVTILNKATVFELIKKDAEIVGCKYRDANGAEHTEYGPVIICTGGYGADYTKDSLLFKHRPDLEKFATTNGSHCTGDGIKMSLQIGGGLADIEKVQVHPTGLVDPKRPDDKVKALAAEALRGEGAIIINPKGQRFVNELGRRDFVSNTMLSGQAPYRLILGAKAAKTIDWHCSHYCKRGLMKQMTLAELAKEMNISEAVLKQTLVDYNLAATSKNDQHGRKYFKNPPQVGDVLHVGIITPVVHYTMGGLFVNTDSQVLTPEGSPIPGLFCSGEVMGGTHGNNRLGGNSLLDCVVYGRISGRNAAKYLFQQTLNYLESDTTYKSTLGSIAKHLSSQKKQTVQETPSTSEAVSTNWENKKFSMEEVSKHTTEEDCWCVVNGEVLNVSSFLNDHPGGVNAIMAYAGKDASETFAMFHPKDTIDEYAPHVRIGKLG